MAITPSFNHKVEPKSIPLPATPIHDMSHLLEEENTSLYLYSPFPFPHREDRQLDDFQQAAWDFLVNNPDEVFIQTVTVDGTPQVRVAVADNMVSQSCVGCHNTHPILPKQTGSWVICVVSWRLR